MAITTEQIHATADQLAKQGIKPTQTNVREALGGGSFSTIATALKSWRDSSTPTPTGELVIPKAVSDKANGLIASIWQIAQQEANRQSLIERDIFIAKENAYIEQLEELQSVIATLEQENDELRATSHSPAPKPDMTADTPPATLAPPNTADEPQDTPQPTIKNKGGRPKGTTKNPKKVTSNSDYNKATKEQADKFALSIAPILKPLIGTMSQAKLVEHLNQQGIKSATGGNWHTSSLANVIKRINSLNDTQ